MDKNVFTFSLTSPAHSNSVALLYFNLERRFIGVTFNSDACDQFKKTFGNELPLTYGDLENFTVVGCTVKDITHLDLSFEQFWKVYDNKVGNMRRCQKLWAALPRDEKIMALGFVPRLRNHYSRRGLQMPYPETYLNQRRWENVLDT